MLCTVLPHDYASGDNLNCFLVEGDDPERLFLVGVLNSLVVEWKVRQIARSNHVKKFMLAQLPVPRPPRADVEHLASLVAALVTTDKRFSDLKPILAGRTLATQTAERHKVKCLIDAEVAQVFGLTEVELNRVLDSYDKVPEETKALVRSCFNKSVRR
jgi:hypothetical protein